MPRIIQHDPIRFPKNKEMREKYEELWKALGEYGQDYFIRHIAWKLFTTQDVSLEEFCAEFTGAMKEYHTNAIPALKRERPDDPIIQELSEEPLNPTELGFFLRLTHDPCFCCTYHAVLAFAGMRPYIPVKAQNVQGDDLLSMLSEVFGGQPQEIMPGVTAFVIDLDNPGGSGSPDADFEQFLETGKIPAPGNETGH